MVVLTSFAMNAKRRSTTPSTPKHMRLHMTDALSVIKGYEGYIDHAKWDRTAYRAGYGSDTTTFEDGSVHPITSTTTVTREDSERDLARRSAEFESHAANQVGQANWAALPDTTRAALTSTTYNYGSLPHDI